MTHSETAFLRAVAENPDDDLPRLVYADWPEEQGNEESANRGAFIRAQVEGRTPEVPPPYKWTLEVMGLQPGPFLGSGFWQGSAVGWVWQRGFPNHVGGPLKLLLGGSGSLL